MGGPDAVTGLGAVDPSAAIRGRSPLAVKPLDAVAGLPFTQSSPTTGIQIVGPHHGEFACLQLGAAYDAASG